MSKILVGECSADHLYELWDADAVSEAEFEFVVARALCCVYQNYKCFVFGGTFTLEGQSFRPDLALVAHDLSHWFIIEVELVSHSLKGHVLPQVRAFRYGKPQPDCVTILSRELSISRQQAETLLHIVPKSVAVIVNKNHPDWEMALSGLQVQLLTVTKYISPSGVDALEVDGHLEVSQAHLGFGVFSAVDRALRFPSDVQLPDGEISIRDADGVDSIWTVTRQSGFTWVTKNVGVPDYLHGSYLQIIRMVSGRLIIRISLTGGDR